MGNARLVVIYPYPTDLNAFERVCQAKHVPMAVAELGSKTKIVANKVLGSPHGAPPFYRIAEIHFPSMQALREFAWSDGGKEALAHAVEISSGGTPIFGAAGEETFTFIKPISLRRE